MKKIYEKYRQAKLYNLGFKQFLSRARVSLKDKMYRKLLLYYVGNDLKVAEAAHSAKFYQKICRRYSSYLSNKNIYDKSWTNEEIPKIIWWCWLQGEDQIPELPKICLNSVRKNLPDYKIKIITFKNLREYIKLPKIIMEKYNAGWIVGAHLSDIIRLTLLAKYGGIWLDSTVYCTDDKLLKRIEKKDMFFYQNMLSPNSDIIKMSNWLIATKRNNPFIVEGAKILTNYYQNSNYTEDYFVCHLILTMLSEKYPEIWNNMDVYNSVNPHMMQPMLNKQFSQDVFKRILDGSSFHKLNRHIALKKGDTFYNHLKVEDRLCDQK